jgi:hypothetical protein
LTENINARQAWWYKPIIPALRRLGKEDGELDASKGDIGEFKVILGYIVRPCLKRKREREREREFPP